jgi:rhamnulokinase
MQLNFSNEGGVEGTTRLLKNVMGLWLLQGAGDRGRSAIANSRMASSWTRRRRSRPSATLIDPDDATFSNPDDMPTRSTGSAGGPINPRHPSVGAYARTVFDSLALKYRLVIRDLGSLIGDPISRVRVIGGGSQNALLNQLTG